MWNYGKTQKERSDGWIMLLRSLYIFCKYYLIGNIQMIDYILSKQLKIITLDSVYQINS